ncbi:Phospholipid methyltransferase [Penicillium expansum]|nr:Phospholipid methyltransferase [Penicillium expansum]
MSSDSALLPIAMLVAGYCFMITHVDPNPHQARKDRNRADRIRFLTGRALPNFSRVCAAAAIYHALFTMATRHAPTQVSQICPLAHNTNPELFAWNMASIVPLLLIYLGTYIRLSAYGGLGKLFTLHLVPPDHLVTTGIYRWVQHPSYTGIGMIWWGCFALFLRWDATPACWIPTFALSQCYGWGASILTAIAGSVVWFFGGRVLDEEVMLQQKFGQEWEQWHRSTKRLIPGVF